MVGLYHCKTHKFQHCFLVLCLPTHIRVNPVAVDEQRFNSHDIQRITRLLSDTDMTFPEIATKMRCSPSAVASINRRHKIRIYDRRRANWQKPMSTTCIGPMEHITVRRMWNYARLRVELTVEEDGHLSKCHHCQQLFKTCLLAESLNIDEPPQTEQKTA